MNGVTLAKLGHFFQPNIVSLKKVYDIDLAVYEVSVKCNQAFSHCCLCINFNKEKKQVS